MRLNSVESKLLNYVNGESHGDTSKLVPLDGIRKSSNIGQEKVDRAIDSLQKQRLIKLVFLPNVFSITALGVRVLQNE